MDYLPVSGSNEEEMQPLIHPSDWRMIGRTIEASQAKSPAVSGTALRDISRYSNSFSASERLNWVIQHSPILL